MRFPPPRGSILLPKYSQAASLAGIASLSACRPLSRAVRAGSWWVVKILGPRLLPFPRGMWAPPVAEEEWQELMARWIALIGPIEAFAVYETSQAERSGLALLAVGSAGVTGFIKVRPPGHTTVEVEALTAASATTTVLCPQVLGAGELGDSSYLVTTAFPSRLHRPPKPDGIPRVADDVSRSLADVSRPSGIPDYWEPMHGDFAPWNLRELRGHGLILFDFEHAGWAPACSDLVFYAAACSALGVAGPGLGEREVGPAVDYWLTRLPERMGEDGRDQRLFRGMMGFLRANSSG